MKYNLTSEKWIDVITVDNQIQTLSLEGVFSNIEGIRNPVGNVLDKQSIYFLLITIVQASLDGPADEDDWKNCKPLIKNKALKYLKKWEQCFDLFDKKHPFLQTTSLHVNGGPNRECAFLDYTKAFGHRHVMCDQEARKNAYIKKCNKKSIIPVRNISNKDIAICLLKKQIFSVSGNVDRANKKSDWNGKEVAKSCAESIAINKVLTIIEGNNLLDTIHNNLITKEWINENKAMIFGRPVWEYDILQAEGKKSVYDIKNDKYINKNDIIAGYLYNLIPFSRSIHIEEDKMMSISDGIRPLIIPAFRHPMLTVLKSKENELYYLKIDIDKAPWRMIQSIVQIPEISNRNSPCGPWALKHFSNKNHESISILTGGLAVDQASLIDICEWNFKIQTELLSNKNFLIYMSFIEDVYLCSRLIMVAVKKYLDGKAHKKIYKNVMSNFWYSLSDYEMNLRKEIGEKPIEELKSQWKKNLHDFSLKTFESICYCHRKRLLSYVKAKIFLNNVLFRRLRNGKSIAIRGKGKIRNLDKKNAGVLA